MVRAGVLGCVLAIGVACAATQKVDPTAARAATYTGTFDEVFQEVALEVKQHYPNLAARPKERAVRTAWHMLPFTEVRETERAKDPSTSEKRDVSPNQINKQRSFQRQNTTREMKSFVRFDVSIEPVGAPGANQWKIVVTGQASEHDGKGIPVELKGAARPYWLDGRMAKLDVAIHNRIKNSSVASR